MQFLPRNSAIVLAAAALTVCVVVALWVARRRSDPPTVQPAATVPPATPEEHRVKPAPVEAEAWVGSRACAACHGQICESYQSHPMAHAAAGVLDAEVVEDYSQHTEFSRPESRTYRVERTPQAVLHHESMTDAAGNLIYDQAVAVDYAIGSGKRGRTYLIDRGGLLKASPISWYTQGARWDLSPGYAPRSHQRFDRRVKDGCIACHVGRVSARPDAPNRFGSPPILEAAISCERCHGPGGAHIRWHESATGLASDDPIVNPKRLPPAAREDVCNQCHMLEERVLQYGHTPYDFRPGQRLEETWVVFARRDAAEPAGMVRAVGQVDQMRTSVCFQRSQGRMGCISCHDPHSSPAAAERQAFYNARCAACHVEKPCTLPADAQAAPPAAGSCIACHMPRLAASDVPHTSQTDHRILRHPNQPAAAAHTPGEFQVSAADVARLPRIELDRAQCLMQVRRLESQVNASVAARIESQLRPALDLHPDDIDVLLAMGTLCMTQRRFDEAREHWLNVLRLRPEDETALRQMVMFERERGNVRETLEYMRRYQAIDSTQADFYGLQAQVLWQAGQRDEALIAANKGLRLDPRLTPLRQWLAGALRQLGRGEEAAEQVRMLERMQGR